MSPVSLLSAERVAQAPSDVAATNAPGGASMRLLRFAVANVTRRRERFVLSTLGIALAILAVTVVRTISVGVGEAGTTSLDTVLDGDPLWLVPAAGVTYDPRLGAFLSSGRPSSLALPGGWTAHLTLTGTWHSPKGALALYGRDGAGAGHAQVGSAAADVLGVATGDHVTIGGHRLVVGVRGGGRQVVVARSVAAPVTGANGWWTVAPPASAAGNRDLGATLSAATGIPSTTDPARRATPSGHGLIYDTTGGGSALTFSQRFSALFSGRVTSSALGLVSTVGLVLGFVIAVSSFLASVQERRREFGIMSSIGLADEVLYFFLVESALVFAVAYVVGVALAGLTVALVVPDIASLGAWAQAAGTVAAYLPAMAIVGALIPVHRLLQQRPVALLAETA